MVRVNLTEENKTITCFDDEQWTEACKEFVVEIAKQVHHYQRTIKLR